MSNRLDYLSTSPTARIPRRIWWGVALKLAGFIGVVLTFLVAKADGSAMSRHGAVICLASSMAAVVVGALIVFSAVLSLSRRGPGNRVR